MTSADIYPLAQDLYAVIPADLRAWRLTTTDPRVRDALADDLLPACDAVIGEAGEEANLHGVLISETLAGFLTGWGCRYGNLDDDVDRTTDNFVLALGGTVRDRGVYRFCRKVAFSRVLVSVSH
jgi:hypothetical protein